MKSKRLKKLTKGKNVFLSKGVSKVKVTEDGKPVCYEIPIKSTGITELVDTFGKQTPKPPVKNMKVSPDSDIAKEMGYTRNEWIQMHDFTDQGYLNEVKEHESDLGIAIVMKGLDLILEDENGKEITDHDQKIETLKEMGMSGDQFSQIVDDIMNLTRWTEEEQKHFLS